MQTEAATAANISSWTLIKELQVQKHRAIFILRYK